MTGVPRAPVIFRHVRNAVELAHAGRIGHGVDTLLERDSQGLLAELRARYRQPVLVEQFVDGRELYVSLVGNGATLTALPMHEVDFREMPDSDDGGSAEASFYVGPRDVFPQEFINFFGFPRAYRELFVRVHGDLLEPAWWNRMKERHLRGEILDVYPYKPARRLHGRYPGDGSDPVLQGPAAGD